jgi:hypothetical protein
VPDVRTIDPETRSHVELIDLGCGDGGSLLSACRRFGVDGIGLDREAKFVERGQRNGFEVYQADVLDLDPSDWPACKYVMLDNVLEHMPDYDAVEQVLGAACRLASRLVHVRHPSFEDEEYLASLGLKQYWTDWPTGANAHTAHVKIHEFAAMAGRLGFYNFEVRGVFDALDSEDGGILPLNAPPNQSRWGAKNPDVYNPERHDPKPRVVFDRPVYFAFDLFFYTGSEVPKVLYLDDPENDPGRPFFQWEGEPVPEFYETMSRIPRPPDHARRRPLETEPVH